jgi:hypothetical protein
MELAAEQWRSRPIVAQHRTMSGAAALAHLYRMMTLELAAARGTVIDIEVEHR